MRNYLEIPLPCQSVFWKWPDLTRFYLICLKLKINVKTEKEKECTIVMDEMCIQTYSQNFICIVGIVDLREFGRRNKFRTIFL